MTTSSAQPNGATNEDASGIAAEHPIENVDRRAGARSGTAPSRADSRARQQRLLLSASLLPASPADDPRVWGDRRPGKGRRDDQDLESMACDYLAERPPHHDR